MIDPKNHPSKDEEDVAEGKPELDSERVKDLTPEDEQTDDVLGGQTTPGRYNCYAGTW